jgi:hypothetical protein
MATVTFTSASAELTQVRGQGHNPLSPIDDGARVRVKRFSFVAAGGETAVALELVELPQGAVVLDTVVNEMSLSNSAEIEIGYTVKSAPVDTTSDALLAATAVVAESAPAEKNVLVGDGIQSVFATTSVGALVAADTFTGYILYVVNT